MDSHKTNDYCLIEFSPIKRGCYCLGTFWAISQSFHYLLLYKNNNILFWIPLPPSGTAFVTKGLYKLVI